VAARLPTRHRHWRRVGSRAAGKKRAAGELLPSSSPTVTATSTCDKKRKKGPQTVDFRFVFLCFFRSAFLPSPSSDLLHCGLAVMGFIFFSSASGGRSGGAAASQSQ